ncbi:MAG: hypothetical protein ABQ298_00115 [Puniceicoccaceae bacterium]
MQASSEHNRGPQPIEQVMAKHQLKNHDLVAASPHPISHKMVARACKGRQLTPHSQHRILDALNATGHGPFTLADLFNYGPHTRKSSPDACA